MAGYLGSTPVPQGIKETQSFTATAGQTTFNTLGYSDGNNISVFLNGVRLINGTDYTATNGSDIVLTAAASASDVLDFETFNEFNLINQNLTTPTFTDSASVTSTTTASVSVSGDTTATLSLKNNTHEDTDGGRESTVIFQGEQSGGEISTLAEIEASHDGTSDDEKGDLIFRTNDGSDGTSPTERIRIDSGGNFLIGKSAVHEFDAYGTAIMMQLESSGTSPYAGFGMVQNSNDTDSAPLIFGKSRGTSAAATTIVQDGDILGRIEFQGMDGADLETGASIFGVVDGTPGANDMPGRLVFNTTADGAHSATERMRINSDGIVTTPYQPSFHATLNSNQTGYNATTSSGTQDYIQYDTDVYDTGNNHSGGTFTAPVDGVYLFRAEAYANVSWSQTWWLVNGARAAGTDTVYASSTSFAHSSAILKLSENDTVRYRGYIAGATNATIYAHANHTWFRGILIG